MTPSQANAPQQIQATVVAHRIHGQWWGIALTGASGAGKSTLALGLMSRGWSLVGDDAVQVWPSGRGLWARPPDVTAGKIEVRGLGLTPVAWRPLCRLGLIVSLGPDVPERMPEPTMTTWLGVSLPHLTLQAHTPGLADAISKALEQSLAAAASP